MYKQKTTKPRHTPPQASGFARHEDLAKMVLATTKILGTTPTSYKPTKNPPPQKTPKRKPLPKKRAPFCNLCSSSGHLATICPVPLSFRKRQQKVENNKLCPLCYAKSCMRTPGKKCINRDTNQACNEDECDEAQNVHAKLLCPIFEKNRHDSEIRAMQREQHQKDLKEQRVAKMFEEREKSLKEREAQITQALMELAEKQKTLHTQAVTEHTESADKGEEEKTIDDEIEEIASQLIPSAHEQMEDN